MGYYKNLEIEATQEVENFLDEKYFLYYEYDKRYL